MLVLGSFAVVVWWDRFLLCGGRRWLDWLWDVVTLEVISGLLLLHTCHDSLQLYLIFPGFLFIILLLFNFLFSFTLKAKKELPELCRFNEFYCWIDEALVDFPSCTSEFCAFADIIDEATVR